MRIWVDADACPRDVKMLLFRTAERRGVRVTLVANQGLATPASAWIDSEIVTGGMNEADRRIVAAVRPGDLVITADVPLAAEAVRRGAEAIDPRGRLYHAGNIAELESMRDLMDELRATGQISGGPSAYSPRDRQAFANQLDRSLTRAQRSGRLPGSS